MNRDDGLDRNVRYYASPQEQKILVQGLLRYFSLPERSQNRNKVVKEVAVYLSMISPHWSHRAVRLWFNNNRHTYLPAMNEQQVQQKTLINPSLNPDVPKIPDKISPFPSTSSNINTSLINSPSSNMNMNNLSRPFQIQVQPPINTTINHPISPTHQNSQIFSLQCSENMPQAQYYNTTQSSQNQPTIQQPITQFPNQIFNSNTNFMPPFQFTSKPQQQQSIQVNAPIQFGQQSQFSKQTQQTSKMLFSPQKIQVTSHQTKIQSPIQKVKIPNPSLNMAAIGLASTIEPKGISAHTQESTNNFFGLQPQSNASTSSFNRSSSNNNNSGFSSTTNSFIGTNGSSFNSSSSSNNSRFGSNAESSTFGFTGFTANSFTNQRGSNSLNSGGGFDGFDTSQFFYQPDEIQKQDQSGDQMFSQISSILLNIRNQQRQNQTSSNFTSPHISQLITDFDKKCMQTVARHGYIPPEKIESNADYITFKFPSLTDDNVFPYSNSTNDFSEINDHFGGQETATVWDQMAPNNIWQERSFIDETLTYFENCLLTDKYFGYTSLQFGSTQRALSLKDLQSDSKKLSVFRVDSESMIDSMCINNDIAFLLSKKKVIRINLLNNISQGTINLDSISGDSNFSVSEGFIKSFGLSSAIISFSNYPVLFFVNNDLSVSKIATNFSGFIDISSFGIYRNNILVCSSNSPTIRMISPDGVEISAFVGHLGQVMGVEPLTENIFVSRGADKTVRIWDYRSPRMISTITTPNTSTLCMTGSKNFVICGFSNKNITVTDIRKYPGKPYLGVFTHDYNAIMMKYNSENDSLMMFGQVEKDTTRDSMIFIDTNGYSRKSILRHYSHFTGVDCK